MKPGNKLIFFLLISLLIIAGFQPELAGQEESFIRGKIIMSGSNQPVQFATVRLKQNQIGVFANADGDFRISNNPAFESDSLIVTCIGYRGSSVAIKDLSLSSENRIYLTPATYDLAEVKIIASRKKIKSTEIIARAIRNIRKNYPAGKFSYICYYRDYQKKDGNYLNLNEAIVQVNDDGFKSLSIYNLYRLLDFRKNTDFQRVEFSPFYDLSNTSEGYNPEKYIPNASLGDQFGNEMLVLMVHDAIRNYQTRSFSFIDVLSTDFLQNHYFGVPEPVYNNNILLYKIFFNAKSVLTSDSLLVTGAIYIQPRDYTIHKIEYTCNYVLKGQQKKQMFNIDIEYGYEKSFGSPMYLKYISFNNLFRVIDPSDSTWFRVVESYLLPAGISNSTIVLVFSNKIDPASASRKDNIEISLGNKLARIKSIEVKGKRLIIILKENNLHYIKDPINITVRNIKDVNGAVVNRRKTIELNQFRELFVQDYNQTIRFRDSCYMQYMPLDKNCITKTVNVEKYWMNTPENIRIR
jgi:hypothetical protein